jgi:hypothetical protein
LRDFGFYLIFKTAAHRLAAPWISDASSFTYRVRRRQEIPARYSQPFCLL